MESLQYCTRQAVRTCANLQPGEKVVVIYDKAASGIASGILHEAILVSSGKVNGYLMEGFGERPDNGVSPLKFPVGMKSALSTANLSFFVAGKTKNGEFESFRKPMLNSIRQNTRLRHIHMPGITEEAFVNGMSIDYHKLREFTMKINQFVINAKQIRVTTPAGSDFTAEFSPQYKWAIADGFPSQGKVVNLPDGETYTCPKTLEGRIVVDGVLGDYFDQKYGLLDRSPLVIEAHNGRIISISSSNKSLEKEFSEYTSKDENANRFGEFAIGTNIGIERLISNMIHDEKFPGVHVAVGRPNPVETGAEWDSIVHCDMVMKKCNIFVDGTQIMSEGKFGEQFN